MINQWLSDNSWYLGAGVGLILIFLVFIYLWSRYTLLGIKTAIFWNNGKQKELLIKYIKRQGCLSLVKLLEDRDISEIVIKKLGEMGDKRAIDSLLYFLCYDQTYKTAEEALTKLGASKVQMVNSYIKALSSWDSGLNEKWNAKINSIKNLGEINDDSIIKHLLYFLGNDQTYKTTEEALTKLRASKENMVSGYILALSGYSGVLNNAVKIGDGYSGVLNNAVKKLGEIGDDSAIKILVKCLCYDDTYKSAKEALENLGASKAQIVSGYITELSSSNNLNAIRELGEIGDDSAIEPLLKLLCYENSYQSAEEALKKLGASNAQIVSAYIAALSIYYKKYAAKRLIELRYEHYDILEKLLERYPTGCEDKFLKIFEEAILYKQEGYDFRVIYSPEISHVEHYIHLNYTYDEVIIDSQEIPLRIERSGRL